MHEPNSLPDRLPNEMAARRRAMGAFAVASTAELEAGWNTIGGGAETIVLRGPEAGLVMLRGRIGGGGAPFNLGEASVTRATVRLSSGELGHAMVLGRDAEKARLAATLDAAWQRAEWREAIERGIVLPVIQVMEAGDRKRAEETEATRVDFFTVKRGDD